VKQQRLLGGFWMAGAVVVLVAQPAWAQIAQVTGVQLNPTPTGVEILLETTGGASTLVQTSRSEQRFVADISNAQLALPQGNIFRQNNPTQQITSVTVIPLDANRLRVIVIGRTEAPTGQVLVRGNQGLVVSLAAPSDTAEQPAPTPDAEDETPEIQAEDQEEIEIVVTGEQETGYQVDNATSATRTDTPLRDIPQSIQVVPQQVIEEQNATTVGEALRNVSGIAVGADPFSIFSDYVKIRGFTVGRDYFKNGIRNQFGGFNLGLDTANIERIEVLKGPASVLYGQAEPGGIVNILTKQPLAEPYYAVDLRAGSFDFFRPTIDFSGPLNPEATLLYRLNAAYQNSDTFVDYVNVERFLIAPVVSLQVSENTNLTLEGEYLTFSGLNNPGLPAVGTALSNPFGSVPRSRFLGETTDNNHIRRNLGNAGYRLEHQFNENWSLRNGFRYEFLDTDEDVIYTAGLQEDNRTVDRSAFRSRGLDQNYALQTDVVGRIGTGNIRQEIVVGTELRRTTSNGELFNADVPSIDLFNPVYGIPPLAFTKTGDSESSQNVVGIYLQDLISFGDKVKFLVGGRYDFVDQNFEDKLNDESFDQQDSSFSPRIGVVYQPSEAVSLYANFSRSFAPTAIDTRNANGRPFEPTTGEQFEVGVKTNFLDGISATLAAYQLTKQNVITDDPELPGFSIQVGEERSRGIELDVIGELLPGLNLIATYAYIDAEITQDNTGLEGNRPNNVPRHSGSLWATYEIQTGELRGLGFGAGLFAVGARQGDLDNSFELPGYIRTDAAIFYRQENWQAGLNFRNLFGIDYYESALGRDTVFPGAPFTVFGTLSVRF